MILIDEPKIELYEGDCIEIMKSMLDNSVDCIITVPPNMFYHIRLLFF